MLEGAISFALAAIAISNIVNTVKHAYAASYYRAIAIEAKTRLELLEQAKNPEWEPVEEEPDE